jgi:hypothetical protein
LEQKACLGQHVMNVLVQCLQVFDLGKLAPIA